ncbi:MAG: methyltransferase domain-containing protein [Rhizobiaceae bacterium]|nr:methyltransferase domain-containing protein [Rhizobiaceae bacterium]
MHADTRPDFDFIEESKNASWTSADYAKIGLTQQITAEELAETTNPAPGAKVLDVAGGNCNATAAFARRRCEVTSTDYVQSLVDGGQMRAEVEGLNVRFQRADTEDLPFDEASFDVVASTFGVMFAANQQQAAAELLRVCRSGGKIALANWTPRGFVGELFKMLNEHVPLAAGVQSPTQWGDKMWVEETFCQGAKEIFVNLKSFNFRCCSAQHFLDFFQTWNGPIHKTFSTLDKMGQKKLEKDILSTINVFNVATDGSMIVPSEYAEVIIAKA